MKAYEILGSVVIAVASLIALPVILSAIVLSWWLLYTAIDVVF